MVKNLPAKAGDEGSIPHQEDPLEKELATHASILAGKSHGQRSLVGYSPWGYKGVEHGLATKQQQQQYLYIYLGALGLSDGIWDLVLPAVIRLCPPALGALSLSHWSNREVLES